MDHYSKEQYVPFSKGQNVPSASLLMTQKWEKWLIYWKAVLPSCETSTGWRATQR